MAYYEIGPVPVNEECAQVGQENYLAQAISECCAFCNQILRHYPAPNEFCRISIKRNRHDFGSYYEVGASVHGRGSIGQASDSEEWVSQIEGDPKGALENWDEEALAEIGLVVA